MDGVQPFGGPGGYSHGSLHDHKPALVLDSWRHRQVSTSTAFGDSQTAFHAPSQAGYGANGKVHPFGERSLGAEPSSSSVTLGDLHLTAGTGYSSLSLDLGVHTGHIMGHLSARKREAIQAAFKRVDPKGMGAISMQELTLALHRSSNLPRNDQDKLVHAMAKSSSSGNSISYADFQGYYQALGSSIDRDKDFEDLMRYHWGFAEVSDILDDMKNKFAMVGLAYAFRRALEHGSASELSMEAFQEAIHSVGMKYSVSDVQRVFSSFSTTPHLMNNNGTLEVMKLTQHLTNAGAQPMTPMTPLHGAAYRNGPHISEVNSQAGDSVFGDHRQTTSPKTGFPHTPISPMHQQAFGSAAPMGSSFHGSHHGSSGGFHRQQQPVFHHAGSASLPTTVPAPPEGAYEAPDPNDPSKHAPVPVPQEDHHDIQTAPPEAGTEHPVPAPHFHEEPSSAPPEPTPEAPSEHPEPNQAPPEDGGMGHSGHASLGHPLSPLSHGSLQVGGPTSAAHLPPTGRRRAVTVGINYIGHRVGTLSGCINDSDTFIALLTEEFGYKVADIRQLRDDHPQRMPSRKNMTAALTWLVSGARAGDHLFFHYSGHGSQQTDKDGDEMDGKDETLVPCDYQTAGMLSDDELRRMLVETLPDGARLTCIMDCCHSGTALDLAYKVKLQADGQTCEVKKKAAGRIRPKAAGDVVMLSGCMDNQTSADIGSSGASKAAGAMTSAFKACITGKPLITYHDLLCSIRSFLKGRRFPQVPQLSCEHYLNLEEAFLPEAQTKWEHPPASLRPPARRALTVGCNYLCLQPGKGRLSGCINDSETMVGIMKEVFGFQDSQICRLRDDRANMMPTKANMLKSLHWLVEGAASGDEMFLHYSGHGGRMKDISGDEASGMDDTLIPCDFQQAGQIIDDDLYNILVAKLPKGCKLWVILDCCHSGTALDLPYKVLLSPDATSCALKKARRSGGGQGSQAEVIMISGCRDDQTSADIGSGMAGVTKAAGAMTTALRHAITPDITCEDLLVNMRHFLKRNNFDQVPQFSSEQFVSLDAGFVSYSQKRRGKMGKRDLPGLSGSQAVAPLSPMHAPLSPMQAPLSPMAMSHMGSHSPMAAHSPVVMDSRIHNLESQIHALRHTQGGFPSSPMRPGF